jgi:hypothetical protein
MNVEGQRIKIEVKTLCIIYQAARGHTVIFLKILPTQVYLGRWSA